MTERRPAHPTKKNYLLVSRIGRKSLHPKWLSCQQSRAFDVFLSCYDARVPEVFLDGVYFERRPGKKVSGYDGFLDERRPLWGQYDFICLMDEDIDTNVDVLNHMFDMCRAYNLKIAQPALTLDSHFTYAALLQQNHWALRYVNFIEMMCPVFRRDVLEAIRPLYSMGYESGIDLIWCNLVAEGEKEFAVVDSAAVRHTEPVGANKSANGFLNGRSYEDDIYKVLNRFELPWLSCVPSSAVDRSGRETYSKVHLVWSSLFIVPAILKQQQWFGRARAVLSHIRNIVRTKSVNIKIDLERS